MYPFQTMFQTGYKLCDGHAPIVASMEEIPLPQLEDLYQSKSIVGAILNPDNQLKTPAIKIGTWVDQAGGRWQVNRTTAKTILFFGYRWNIGLHMLLQAFKAGYSKIVYLRDDGVSFEDLSVSKTLASNGLGRSVNRILGSFKKLGFLQPVGDYLGQGGFDKAYDDMIARLDNLDLNVTPDEIIKGKVLMHIGTLGPGGAERQLTYAASGIHARGKWKPTVLVDYLNNETNRFYLPQLKNASVRAIENSFEHDDVIENQEDSELYSYFINNHRHTGFQNLIYKVIAYAKIIQKEKPEIVHCWMDASNVMFGLAASIVGVPKIILSCRSAAPDNFEIFQPYMKPGYKKLMARQDVIFLNNSHAGAIDYARWLKQPDNFQTVIHNGFEFPKITRAHNGKTVRKRLGLTSDAPVIGSIIRFSEEKRPRLMVDAIAKVIQKNPKAKGLIYGNGTMHTEIKEYVASLGLKNKILLPGYTKDAWKSLGAMDIFMLTSRMEGLPNVLVEAQIMGLPVVTTGKGGMNETYIEGETGITAGKETAASLAQACLEIISKPQRCEKMQINAKKQSIERFSIEHMVDLLHQSYDRA